MVGVNMRRLALIASLNGMVFVSSAFAATILPVSVSASAIQAEILAGSNGTPVIRRQDNPAKPASRKITERPSKQSAARLDDRSVQAGLLIGGAALLAMILRRKRRSYSVTA